MVAAFNAADKLCNTPSPNLFMYLLCFVYIYFNWYLFPVMMSSVAHDDYYIAPMVTFSVCYFFGLLVVIAIDMDNPFDDGMIDLPLEVYENGLRKDMDMILGDFDEDGQLDDAHTPKGLAKVMDGKSMTMLNGAMVAWSSNQIRPMVMQWRINCSDYHRTARLEK